ARELVDDLIDQGRMGHGRRTAAKAGTEPLALGLRGRCEEPHVLAQGTTRTATRPAVHARRLHGIHELAVAVRVLVEDGLPALLLVQHDGAPETGCGHCPDPGARGTPVLALEARLSIFAGAAQPVSR